LPEIVDKILDAMRVQPQDIDLVQFLPTGIHRLDQILYGGFPRPSSILIIGPKGIGKTTLGIQIQIAALDRGEPCVYITYREPPHDIINYMLKLGAPVEAYVEAGKFKVLDNFSAPNGLSDKEIKAALAKGLHSAIVRVEDPADQESYYKIQVELMESMGMGGVNVIDSVNERYLMISSDPQPDLSTSKYFQRFRTKLSRIGGQSALHLASMREGDEQFNNLLVSIQDGIIQMKYEETLAGRRRHLRVESLRGTRHNDRWFEFVITFNGIEFL
jgi:KaiC/GvpD/RAD55 family RecA-like ATPase